MKAFGYFLAFTFTGLMPHCHSVSPPPPGEVKTAPALGTASTDKESKVAAAVQGAQKANESNPAGPAKDATAGELGVAAANLNPPKDEDKAAALERVNKALTGDVAGANAAWAKAREDGFALQQQVAALTAQVTREREEAKAELTRQLAVKDAEIAGADAKAKRAADAKLNFWLQLGCFGLGALGLVGAAVSLQLAATVPILGPNITRALFIAGGVLIGLGLLIRSVDRFVDQHPQLFFGGLIAVILLAVTAGVLAYANHQHAKPEAPAPLG